MHKLYTIATSLFFVFNGYSQVLNWGISTGSTERDQYAEFAIDNQGDIISVGYTLGDIDLDPSTSNAIFQNNGQEDLFIQKVDAQGNYVWGKLIGGTERDYAYNVATDNSGNIYILGVFQSTVDFNEGGTGGVLTSNGDNDIFLLKLDNNGNFLWVKQIGGTEREFCREIKLDDNENVYLVGRYRQTVDFGLGGTAHNLTSNGQGDTFILKMNSNGDYIWVYSYGHSGEDYTATLMFDNSGNLILSGGFTQTVDFDNGVGTASLTSGGGFFGMDSYLLKLSDLGEFEWVKHQITSVGDVFVTETKMDNLGNIYSIGLYEDIADFDPSVSGNSNTPTPTTNTYFIQKLDSNGGLVWVKFNDGIDPRSFVIDNSNNLILSGTFNGTKDFDIGTGVYNLTPAVALRSAFVQTIDADGNFIEAYALHGANNQSCIPFVRDLESLDDGSLLMLVHFEGSIDIDSSPNNETPITSQGDKDLLIIKLSSYATSTKEINNINNVEIYPNPSKRFLDIKTTQDILSLKVINSFGQVVLENKQTNSIDLESIPTGVYFIKILLKNETIIKKIIKN